MPDHKPTKPHVLDVEHNDTLFSILKRITTIYTESGSNEDGVDDEPIVEEKCADKNETKMVEETHTDSEHISEEAWFAQEIAKLDVEIARLGMERFVRNSSFFSDSDSDG